MASLYLGGLSFPSKHFRPAWSYRGQSGQFILTGVSLLAFVALTVAGPQLTFENGSFVISEPDSDKKVVVATTPSPSPIDGGKFKTMVNGVLVSFDQRGLGVQYRGKGGFSGLTYVPTSPKAFSALEIVQNTALIKSDKRLERVSALSGFETVGNVVFLLVRWEEADGKPWLEAVVSIDTSGEEPVTKYVGRFAGMTRAKGTASDELHAGASGLLALVNQSGKSGIGLVALPSGSVSERLFESAPHAILINGNRVLATEKTEHGTTILSVLDESSLAKRPIFETRGAITDIKVAGVLAVTTGGVLQLLSLETGALTVIEKDAGTAETAYGVLVWSPKSEPKNAAILELDGWSRVATWSAAKRS